MPELSDAEGRQRIATDLGETLFVEAGAGTGKTQALVGRVVELVTSGRAYLGQIAAITFTEAAATELRERVGARLEALARQWPADVAVRSALSDLDDAMLTTIHGFAQRILAENALAAGLPLRLRVLDDLEADLERTRRFDVLLDALLEEAEARETVAAALALGVAPTTIGELARQIDDAWDLGVEASRAAGRGDAAGEPSNAVGTRVTGACARVAEAMRAATSQLDACTDPADRLAGRIRVLAEHLLLREQRAGWLVQLRWLAALPAARVARTGSKKSWSCPVDEVREIVAEYERCREEARDEVADEVLGALVARLAHEAVAAADERRRSGTLRFHDLLVHARDLLVRNPEVLSAVRRRFVQVLVDEFQDTDPLQLEIVRLVAGDGADGRPAKGRLFFVGDPKQAIYRFRGADVALYERVRSEIDGGRPTRLVTSFRSVPGILDWVNGVFSQLLGAGDGIDGGQIDGDGIDGGGPLLGVRRSAAFTPLVPSRARTGVHVPVTLLGGPTDAMVARERRRLACADVARSIVAAVEDGWPVLDGDTVRPARLSDVAVLVPRRTGLDELEEALDDADVAYRVDASSVLYGSTEVLDLLACLRAVDNPGDELAIVAALRTPELACGDDALAEYRDNGGQWRIDARAPVGLESHAVTSALAEIGRLHSSRHELGAAGTLEAIVTRWRAAVLTSALRRRDEASRRIRLVVDQARELADAGSASIAELLTWADYQRERAVRSTEVPGDAGDSVRILTIHGAKGLEFPIVVLTELGSRPLVRRGPTVLAGESGRLEVRVVDGLETSGYSALAAADADLDVEEQLRLCYVAATRARDHLVVSVHHTPAGQGAASLAERLWGASQAVPETWRRSTTSSGSVLASPVAPRRGTDRAADRPAGLRPLATSDGLASWIAERDSLLRRIAQPERVAATSLGVTGGSAVAQ
ncbi:MAG: UvrD-helicase domain-containing protein, partial [Acidimicrobiales bacterium]